MARDSTESRFRQVLEDFGGPQNVLLIGELWDRAQSRDILESFLSAVFPGEKREGAGNVKSNSKDPPSSLAECKGPQEPVSDGKVCREQPKEDEVLATPPCGNYPIKQDRALRFPLVFFLCRAESVRPRNSRRQLLEILKDLRERTRVGAAVIGVMVQSGCATANGESPCEGSGQDNSHGDSSPDSPGDDVASLLSLLQTVFPPGSRGARWWEVRAAVFIQGQDETRKDVQNVASEALAAADVNKSQRPQTKFQCFPWRRRKTKRNFVEKATSSTVEYAPNCEGLLKAVTEHLKEDYFSCCLEKG